MSSVEVLDELRIRGLIHTHTDEHEIKAMLSKGAVTLYHGIDPTGSSLHIGHLVGIQVLRRFQQAGHKPLVLVGGATGMVGDPSGQSVERNLIDSETLAVNVSQIASQLKKLLDFDGQNAAKLVNNFDWTQNLTLLDFLRDTGKYVTVNQMVAKESVRARMASENGISFTEFSYMLLQAFDYWWQYENFGCTLQIGGSDQWGNITAGIDMIRRRSSVNVHGLTWPLMTKSDGSKFGKTSQGSLWLDANRTLPYEIYQYLVNTDDKDVERLILQLTDLPFEQVKRVMSQHISAPHLRQAQQVLASEVCTFLHGEAATSAVKSAGEVLFGNFSQITEQHLTSLEQVMPKTVVEASSIGGQQGVSVIQEPAVDVLLASGLCVSRGAARRMIKGGGVRLNSKRVHSASDPVQVIADRFILVRLGRKQHHLLVIE